MPDNKKEIRLYLDGELRQQFKVYCTKRGISMTANLIDYIQRCVEEDQRSNADG